MDDLLCRSVGLPRFAIKMVIPYLTFTDVLSMMIDILISAYQVTGQDFSGKSVPGVASLIDTVEELLTIEFSVYFEFSTIEALAEDGGLAEWGSEGIERGLYVNMSAYASFAGFTFDFALSAVLRLPGLDPSDPQALSFLASFFANPMGLITGEATPPAGFIPEVGFSIRGDVMLPLGIGEASFYGTISLTLFAMGCNLEFAVGPFSLYCRFEFIADLTTGVTLEFAGGLDLSILGYVSMYGSFIGTANPSWEMSGTVCKDFFGFYMSGFVYACAGTSACDTGAAASFAFSLETQMGYLGLVEVGGSIDIDDSGVYMAGYAQITFNFDEMVDELIDSIVQVIAGTRSDKNPVVIALRVVFNAIAFAVCPICTALGQILDYARIELDSRKLALGIELALNFGSFKPTLAFELSLGRRRLEGSTPSLGAPFSCATHSPSPCSLMCDTRYVTCVMLGHTHTTGRSGLRAASTV